MSQNSWLHLDDLRESWLFLITGRTEHSEVHRDPRSSDEQIEYWELGIGNPESLIRTTAASLSGKQVHSQSDLLDALLSELRNHRYQDTLLITLDQSTLQRLRSCLIATDIEIPSLRGLTHVDVESQLQSQFGQSLGDYGLTDEEFRGPRVTDDDQQHVVTTGTVELVWEVWRRVYRLIPASSLEGVPL
jgi:hypothetical protein